MSLKFLIVCMASAAASPVTACEVSRAWFDTASEAAIVDCVDETFLDARADDQSTAFLLAIENGMGVEGLDAFRERSFETFGNWEDWDLYSLLVDDEQRGAFHFAARYAEGPDVIRWLWADGFEPDVLASPVVERRMLGDLGTTPLHVAVQRPDGAAIVRALLAAGITVDTVDAEGYEAIHLAARSVTDVAVLEAFLIADGGDAAVFDRKDAAGNTALTTAAASDRPFEIVDYMLSYGADADHANEEGLSALHLAAARATDPDVVWRLFDSTEAPCAASETVAAPLDRLSANPALGDDPDLRRMFHERCVEGR